MKLSSLLILLLLPVMLKAQMVQVHFQLYDSSNHEVMTGVVIRSQGAGTRTDANGKAMMKSKEGVQEFVFSFAGYQEKHERITVASTNKEITVEMVPTVKELRITTISGSRYEKKIAEEIVSIEVLKPGLLLSRADNQVDDALRRVPGVDVVNNQVNIRGGSGWSYGAGSRVLVMVDDMPMLTADAADAKWDFLPLENCEQIEVVKGASSSLYGSSALNGVINFRTGFAKDKPKTKVMLYNAMYGNPPDKSWIWWDKQQPGYQGGYFSHSQKFKQLDVVLGSAWYSEDSYLQGDLNRRMRGNVKLRYRFKKINGLTAGLNINLQKNKSQTFFFWQPDSIKGDHFLQPFGGLDITSTSVNKNSGTRFNIDPYLIYYAKNGGKHTLRTRWFRSQNDIPEKQQSSLADSWYREYQYQQMIQSSNVLLDKVNIVTGLVSSYNKVNGELFGNHTTYNAAPYLQLEKKIGHLSANLGIRYEANQVDTYRVEKKPVIRFGANYKMGQATYLRASYGQGYRYPSVAERFVETSFGPSRVFKNPELKSETGWSSEIGLKQGYKINSWLGMIDLSLFWMEYQDMMEFNFGLFVPKDSSVNPQNFANFVGFKSINVGRSRINGIDLSVMGMGTWYRNITGRFTFGYTYMNPMLIHPDSAILANVSGNTNTLKYRYRNSVKFDMEQTWRKITLGNTIMYNSFMQNIDEVFENTKPPTVNLYGALFQAGTDLPRSVHDFRQKHYKGNFIWDTRIAYQLSTSIRMSFIVKNVLNTIYTERPALIAPLRSFTLQLLCDL